MSEVRVFELADVARILGMPKSKVTNWTIGRPFYFPASFQSGEGKGTRNLYSVHDVIVMALVNELRNVGLSIRDIETVLKLFWEERRKVVSVRIIGSPFLLAHAINWLIIQLKANEISVNYLIQNDPPAVTMPDEKNVVVGNYMMNLTALVNKIQKRISEGNKGISLIPVIEEEIAADELNE